MGLTKSYLAAKKKVTEKRQQNSSTRTILPKPYPLSSKKPEEKKINLEKVCYSL
ncbi:MAG: hypothetical protein OEM28_03200 [Nitrosopumilus sp.]|nr:hypothetical protein [Nitrosopumilus sp.]MDH3488744.1 hypothetical protein [Nitrosopumilus sp.]